MNAQNPARFILASLLSACPGREHLADIEALLPALAEQDSAAAKALYARLSSLSQAQLLELHSDYIDLFDRGHAANPIYETEYGRHRAISKTTELADLAGFYQAFGLARDGLPEMPDHLSVELEFYAWLLLKAQYLAQRQDAEGQHIVAEAGQKFLQAHLGSFAGQLADCPGVAGHPFYRDVFVWIAELVAEACRELGVVAAPAAYFKTQSEAEEFGCASLGGCGIAGLSPRVAAQPQSQKQEV